MSYQFSVGIDVSKATVDVAMLSNTQPELVHHNKFANSEAGVNDLFNWLINIPGFNEKQTIFCMEATGLYCYILTEQLHRKGMAIWIENSVQIKRSIGIVRGKNDKTDAIRIAKYAAGIPIGLGYGSPLERLWKKSDNCQRYGKDWCKRKRNYLLL